MTRKTEIRGRALSLLTVALLAGTALCAPLATRADSLSDGFADPPNSARPRVWWHWMNGNVAQEGIDLDLRWMKRVGIGGLQNFDANLATPQVVDKRLAYMTPEWKAAFRHTAELADQLGLELAIASSPGWSETGGPWVKPKDAMKKLVWSATDIDGGKPFKGVLKAPPSVTGPFQDIPAEVGGVFGHQGPEPLPTYFADSAVVAYRIAEEKPAAAPVATSSAGPIAVEALLDDSLTTKVAVTESADRTGWVQYDFHAPRTVRSAVLGTAPADRFVGDLTKAELQASDDGVSFRKVADLATGASHQQTTSFKPTTARYYRLVLSHARGKSFNIAAAAAPGADLAAVFALLNANGVKAPPAKPAFSISKFVLSDEERVQDGEVKAGFAVATDYYALERADRASSRGPAPETVVDLTAKMKPDGKLDWTPPKGRWRVLRLGYSLTGTENHPATLEATGLEVDKLDKTAVRSYLETYLDTYKSFLGPDLMGKRGVVALLNDSTEVGPQNWTGDILAAFKARRGYDATPWLPSLTGAVIGDGARSDAFLYDFRKTLAELHAEHHYGTVAAVARERGLFNYGEALEDGRPSLGDDLEMRRYTSIPMAAMWTYDRKVGPKPSYLADIRGAASVAHLYGQNLVAAESMTAAMSPWAFTPRDLKSTIDLEFVLGVNRPVIHTSVHQPLTDKKPGLSLSIFGQYFNRNETWAEMAGPWVDYMSRNAFMLQQGRFFADVAYFSGEEAPLTGLYVDAEMTDAPHGYAFDFVNSELLLNSLEVKEGALVAKSGASYQLLYLGGSSRRMSLAVLRRVHGLVEAGLSVAGVRPEGSPALADDPVEYKRLADDLWPAGKTEAAFGKGRVFAVDHPDKALAAMGLARDFDAGAAKPDADVRFVHRRLDDGDSYFVNNRLARPETLEARFRVAGKVPELWRPETGKTEPLSYRIENGVTVVPLALLADDAVHVVFRKTAAAASLVVPAPKETRLSELSGPWKLTFEQGRGAPAGVTLDALSSWSDAADPGVKYFSGVGTYSRDLTVKASDLKGGRIVLDLGEVRDLAEVFVNGARVGQVWHAPYRLDVTDVLKAGRNALEIKVANPWVNRLIGDTQPGAKKVTFTVVPTYVPGAPLRPSGLLGPVTLTAVTP
ncbi:glycoside hydrolase [Caulobacter sp. CCUG 60055]|uniref:glycosyl hydrolase n=3 Tax=Bacteria TaxID=2 RepID=UPI001FA76ACE|nr:glycosyl hydrolase [Caulobacter sp. CCUG 60055]MBQ1542733.1 discoidin domain-containing protein [Caulobacteraceae bacterium]MCI3179531.1 glycoside hydrolase [Caulobacter sp. CCUG 60055]